jgi:hypothetical protein
MEYYFPDNILAHIISFAESIPIDTRLVFGVPPKRLIVEKELQCKLKRMCLRRTYFYKLMTDVEHQITYHKGPLLFDLISIKLDNNNLWLTCREYNNGISWDIELQKEQDDCIIA